ncbi:helix-turn-helix domain-containing protein [Mesorhizobium qingshengii]|uniref:Helix-turn-helix domain-containing protein n=1 Tax=Mesorhizobium qingshengii TaxID=1165689 RepID=A0ABT4R4C4_9HYPH|nr:helix-turn-helix domain-containing protein [Mesorhizobium qingshengii]MCZ8548692.1 helix-turn-helix domain-containing protein [Mesorhizobium qingshengii]
MASEQTPQFFAYKALCIAKISSGAKAVGALLLDHRNEITKRCDPSLRTMVRRLGISKSSVLRGLAELIEASLFRRVESDTYRTAYQVNFVKLRAIVTAFEATRKAIPRNRKTSPKTDTSLEAPNQSQIRTQTSPKTGTGVVPKLTPQHLEGNTLNLTLGSADATPRGFQIDKSNGEIPSNGPSASPPPALTEYQRAAARASAKAQAKIAAIVAKYQAARQQPTPDKPAEEKDQ